MQSVAAPYLPANREEGVIKLGKPVLKVQEINSIGGKHQTMLIREEEARQLIREELLMEAKLARESKAGSAIAESDSNLASDDDPLDYLWSYDVSKRKEDASDLESDGESTIVDTNLEGSIKVTEVDVDPSLTVDHSSDERETGIERSSSDEHMDEQPLVGYWSWDNSIRVHRMKMHVGKNSDFAMHIVLAVVTNQLRNERHAALAVAM